MCSFVRRYIWFFRVVILCLFVVKRDFLALLKCWKIVLGENFILVLGDEKFYMVILFSCVYFFVGFIGVFDGVLRKGFEERVF